MNNLNSIMKKIVIMLLAVFIISCSEETLLTIENEPNALITRYMATIRCVDAYIQVGPLSEEYRGTHCWRDGGSSAPSLPVGAVPSAPYIPNGYPSSQGGGSAGFSSSSSWTFSFNQLKTFMGNCTKLNLLEKEKLTHVLELFIGNEIASVYEKFYNFMKSKNLIITYTIGSTVDNAPAQYDRVSKTITYNSIDGINFRSIVEEYVHVLQDQYFYGKAMLDSRVYCEFEAKVFADIANYVGMMEEHGVAGVLMGSYGQSNQFVAEYGEWIEDLVIDRGCFFSGSDVAIFRELCSKWTGYEGSYSSSFDPRLLRNFFNITIRF